MRRISARIGSSGRHPRDSGLRFLHAVDSREPLVCITLVPGTVSERPKVQLSKSCVLERAPWVQIPPVPPRKSPLHPRATPGRRGFSSSCPSVGGHGRHSIEPCRRGKTRSSRSSLAGRKRSSTGRGPRVSSSTPGGAWIRPCSTSRSQRSGTPPLRHGCMADAMRSWNGYVVTPGIGSSLARITDLPRVAG